MYYFAFALLLAALLGSLAFAGAALIHLWQKKDGIPAFIEKGHILVTGCFLMASAFLLHALYWKDYRLDYVSSYTDNILDLFYRLTAFWAGQPGSMLFWGLTVAVMGSLFALTTNYMAPASARQMASDLALLPMWYAEAGSAVLAPSAYNADFLKTKSELLGMDVALLTEPEVADGKDRKFSPWGWDPALRKRLMTLGADQTELPSADYMNILREHSHRLQAVKLLPGLRLNEYFCGESFYLSTLAECSAFVEGREACLLKAPLSGSGKGLNWCKGIFTTFISGWCARVAASQGGVVGEPIYNKVEDFAMEFYADGRGRVVFAGYSVFHTGGSGMYAGNDLLSDEKILQKLSAYVPQEEFIRLRTRLEEELSALFGGFYHGYLGVDMMICHFPDEAPVYRIHPCVEINLRMNMGVVAWLLTDRYLAADAEGVFRIDYYPLAGQALEEHRQMSASFPLSVENNRVCAGYLPLVPVTPQSRYRAFLLLTLPQ